MPKVLKLKDVKFTTTSIKSGETARFRVQWQSTAAADLVLHYEADKFSLSRDRFPLPADADGDDEFEVKVTRKAAAVHCDVNFQLGDDHDQDSVEVT